METDGRYEIGTASGSLLDALGELQVAMASDSSQDEVSVGLWSTDGTTAVPPSVVIPESDAPRQPTPSTPGRATSMRSVQTKQAEAAPAPIPSVVDRIATMPRFRSESAVAHPTGEAWLSPKQRQFCERPPV